MNLARSFAICLRFATKYLSFGINFLGLNRTYKCDS